MIKSKQYKISNIDIKLLGSKTHYLYNTSSKANIFAFFRRFYINLTIETLYCEREIIIGCFINKDKRAIIELKSDNIQIFISGIFTLKNIKLSSIDMNLYYNNLFIFANTSVCSENELINQSLNKTLSNCYINNKNAIINSDNLYGFINL